ncbi:hypothetical protein BhaS171_00052 [Bacillus phage vB_BhaS-171]|uniref:DnaD-like helicase loader n=1 Tax=Bacillus phage vB_BhaS-171 TaxID=1775140 RepID=UPI0007448BF8|nr:DnaD-like helicase loader [Bacillus phage vB_BhaS-171]ALY08108.1 hypothetical protein BhaS171_00052 [Bacillus phage vB_BhaS-171]
MNKLLLDDKPLIILPSLAEKIGLNESIVLQQLHYWLMDSKNFRDGEKWVYNTYKDWQKQFPFWSEKTIRRTITKLENEGLILTGNYNKMKIDQTKWYRIDYNKIVSSPCGQNDQTKGTNCPDGVGQNDHTNNQRIPETTTDNIYSIDFESFWTIYPRKVDKKKAFKSFKTASKSHTLEIILSGTEKYAKQVQKERTELRFVKHPATFLNNDSFLDGYEEEKQPTQPKQDEQSSVLAGIWGD